MADQGKFNRIIWVVLDSVGIGEMPDAANFGGATGADTVGNLARATGLSLPNLRAMGLANIRRFEGLDAVEFPSGCYGRAALASPGKDTTTGHWEMAGIILERPFPLYPNGFPSEVIGEFERRTGRRTLGNCAASGTEIIRQLGAEHMRTGTPIVYTSADSVFQIAAHEDVIPVPELYRICEVARDILRPPHEVGRVIARPFTGVPGSFTRTANRHDYAVPPPAGMLLDRLAECGTRVQAVGKIADIFLGRGIRDSATTKSNAEGMQRILDVARLREPGLVFANLVDFDMLYGHRNDPAGYADALEKVDGWLPRLLDVLAPDDLLILTADHGCDPTTASTDHDREYVPVLAYSPSGKSGVNLGFRETLADIGQTVANNFGTAIAAGRSFLHEVA
jgi:phosphopentomutase